MSATISGLPGEAVRTPEEESRLEAVLEPLLLPAYRLAYGMLRDRQEAEDAVQEAALRAWTHRATFRKGAEVKPWFFAIVANQCRTYRRGRWSRLIRRPDLRSQPPETADDLDADLDLRRALSRLSPDDRLVIVLRYYLDLRFDEIAATLRVSEDAARSRTHRAVRRLRPLSSEELTR